MLGFVLEINSRALLRIATAFFAVASTTALGENAAVPDSITRRLPGGHRSFATVHGAHGEVGPAGGQPRFVLAQERELGQAAPTSLAPPARENLAASLQWEQSAARSTYYLYDQDSVRALQALQTSARITRAELEQQDAIMFALVKNHNLPPTLASKLYAYVITAQADAAILRLRQ